MVNVIIFKENSEIQPGLLKIFSEIKMIKKKNRSLLFITRNDFINENNNYFLKHELFLQQNE
ncbi:hypothetical protein EDL98_03745 [Ornithobacterium rhinotracheale]|nr:hypothetical protein [Ornithobacterium rhinotracheale]MRJ10190.1 hypothetical protein [Ornithobacterium rhinotracheale]